jgi:predicted amidophosphoribosyltransferase
MLLPYFHKKESCKLIHKLKYKGHEDIGAVLGNWYAADLKNILRTANMLIPFCTKKI